MPAFEKWWDLVNYTIICYFQSGIYNNIVGGKYSE